MSDQQRVTGVSENTVVRPTGDDASWSSGAHYAITDWNPKPTDPCLTILDDQGNTMVTILFNGTVQLADGVDVDDAARRFWAAIQMQVPSWPWLS